MRPHRVVLAGLLASAVSAAPAAAQLPGAPQNFKVQVIAVNGDGTSTFSPCGIGGQYRFPSIPGATVGQVWSVDVNMSSVPWTTSNEQLTNLPPCMGTGQTFGPPGANSGVPFPSGATLGPGMTFAPGFGSPDDEFGDEGELFALADELPRAAFNRVFTFRCDADGYAGGELSVTINAVKGLGKALRDDFEAVVDDQDGLVLVGKFAKVFRDGKRVRRGALDDADSVAVKGKLLRPDQWSEDEDGNQVPTIRAKRITITG